MINRQAHTITELLIAAAVIIFLFASVLGAFILTKSVYYDSIANYNLQRDVDTVLATIIRGSTEQTGRFGLRSAVSIPAPGLPPVPGQNNISFIGTDNNTRRYSLSNNTIVYNSPTQTPNQRVIYTAPPNSNITLRFASASADQQVVYIYIGVSQLINNKIATGSVVTNVNLRNMPK
jgi:hypothetical protein